MGHTPGSHQNPSALLPEQTTNHPAGLQAVQGCRKAQEGTECPQQPGSTPSPSCTHPGIQLQLEGSMHMSVMDVARGKSRHTFPMAAVTAG